MVEQMLVVQNAALSTCTAQFRRRVTFEHLARMRNGAFDLESCGYKITRDHKYHGGMTCCPLVVTRRSKKAKAGQVGIRAIWKLILLQKIAEARQDPGTPPARCACVRRVGMAWAWVWMCVIGITSAAHMYIPCAEYNLGAGCALRIPCPRLSG